MHEQFDGKFHVFMKLNRLIEEMFPAVEQYTTLQSTLIHRYADEIAKELLSGQFVYVDKKSTKKTGDFACHCPIEHWQDVEPGTQCVICGGWQ